MVSKLADGERPKAPGMKYRHYAPKAPVTVVTGDAGQSAAYIAAHCEKEAGIICFSEFLPLFAGHEVHDLGPMADLSEQARRVFDALRRFDETPVPRSGPSAPAARAWGWLWETG